jgi:5-hydroxyisourate hydrolase
MASGGPTGGSATISTHVLDVERGRPAAGITVTLFRLAEDGRPIRMTQAITNADGRIADLLERPLQAGDYRLRFDSREDAVFFRSIALDFRVVDVSRSYHVPLLLAPFSMTAYRGS